MVGRPVVAVFVYDKALRCGHAAVAYDFLNAPVWLAGGQPSLGAPVLNPVDLEDVRVRVDAVIANPAEGLD